MKFLLVTAGSRGDTEPFIALAYALRRVGHEATVAAPARYRPVAMAHAVPYIELDDSSLDLQEELARVGPRTAMASVRKAKRAFEAYLRDVADLADFPTEHVLFHPKTLVAPMIAERQQVAGTLVQLIPLYRPTRAFAAPLLAAPRLPRLLNRVSWRLVTAVEAPWRPVVDRLRCERFGLRGSAPSMGEWVRRHGTIDAWSPTLLPAPPDWPQSAQPVGFWRLPAGAWEPPADLDEFLAGGEAPVYVGFGSMVGRDPAGLGTSVVEGIRRTGRRAVVVTGAGGLAVERADDVFVAEQVPHWWLMPQVAAAVHHGGVGTTASALIAGTPQVISPFMGDQGFWADRAAALGVATVARRRDADQIARAVEGTIARNTEEAARVAIRVRDEDGLGRAVRALTA